MGYLWGNLVKKAEFFKEASFQLLSLLRGSLREIVETKTYETIKEYF